MEELFELEHYKEFIEALLKVVNDIDEEYPAFAVAVARKIGKNVSEEESQKFNFHFVPHNGSLDDAFVITITKKDIEWKKLTEKLTYYGAIYRLLKDNLYRRYTRIMEEINKR